MSGAYGNRKRTCAGWGTCALMAAVGLLGGFVDGAAARGEGKEFRVSSSEGEVRIEYDGRPFARYVYADETITRPYFCDLCAPSGVQVTRTHPPGKDDLQDHATYHPGLWLAFADINGHDYWRLKARVAYDGFEKKPYVETISKEAADAAGGARQYAGFAVRNRYLSTDGKETVCEERCAVRFFATGEGHWIVWDSAISSAEHGLAFGDQEEMGLGVRLATAVAVQSQRGGEIWNADGRRDEKEIWGRRSAWCDYRGVLADKRVGAAIFPHPKNPRECWWHVRDYGLQVANGFGERSVAAGETGMLNVARGETLRLRYGVLLHAGEKDARPDMPAAYGVYQKLAAIGAEE